MSTMVNVWVIDTTRPLRQPMEARAVIERKPKGDWAVINGRRFLIGTSAFLAEKPAMQRWQGILDKMRKDRYVQHAMPHRAERANALCKSHVYGGRVR